MKVLIVNSMAPFIRDGVDELASHLQRNLSAVGHEAEVMRIPFQEEPASRIPSQMLMVRAFELSNVDRVIALNFPAYLIRHPRKTLWLLQPQACNMFDMGQSDLPPAIGDEQLRVYVRRADSEAFAESRHVFVSSQAMQQSLRQYNSFDADVLLPPISDAQLFTGGQPGDYIFAGGVNGKQRQKLLLEALALADRRVRLIIAVTKDTPAEAEELQRMVVAAGLGDRVKLDLCCVSRPLYAAYINQAAAVAWLPSAEDLQGYGAMEAAAAGKALITVRDSSGVPVWARDGETGWVVQPSAEDLAGAMSAVYENRARLTQYGDASRSLWHSFGINWPRTVEALLQ